MSWSSRDRWACGCDVVSGVPDQLIRRMHLYNGGVHGKEVETWAVVVLTIAGLGDWSCVTVPCTRRCVVPSVIWCHFISTSRPKCRRKSAPMIGLWSSAMTNTHWKLRRRPRLRVSESVLYVGMGVLLTACKVRLSFVHL